MKLKWQGKSKIDRAGIKAVRLLQEQGFEAFWVGGIVRNILLKRESDNVDIATVALPDEIEKILNDAGIKSKPVGKQFGSILTVVDGVLVEITTFRSEGRYSDQRHPDQVKFIKEYLSDAKRRDFTINALYFDPNKKELYDPTTGIKDLRLKLLRFVGDPKKRIDEDALRMLRGVRLAIQLGFKLEKNSFAAIKTRAKYIQGISGERIKAELDKILLSGKAAEGIEMLDQIGLLKFIIPELVALQRFDHHSKIYHLEGDIFTHTLLVVQNVPDDNLALLYAALFHDTGKFYTRIRRPKDEGWVYGYHGHEQASEKIFLKFADKFKFPRKDRELIHWLIKHHGEGGVWDDSNNVKKIRYALQENFSWLLLLWRADGLGAHRQLPNGKTGSIEPKRYFEGQKILKMINAKQTIIQKLAKGGLIMKYGKLQSGPIVGQKIEEVKLQIISGKIKNERDLKKYLESSHT